MKTLEKKFPTLDPPEKQQESALKAGYDKVYLKSEADNVIAELKDKLRHYPMMAALIKSGNKEIAELKKSCKDKDDWCLHTLKENRHHKYKRCLSNAKSCEYRWMNLEKMIDTEYRTKKMRLSQRWWRIWLKLAETLKEER